MIRVENLTKRYGHVDAIRDVSFQVSKGEVLGFLGPNGAGKSTTMRILTGCIGASGGRALVGEDDVLQQPLKVKRRIGYLPENPPVYPTMSVRDYLAFAATIKGVSDTGPAVQKAMDRTGLTSVGERIIGHLSKGYRQRVGLAQALVHDPEVLVLDEPTSGLDPAQRVEIRDLLRELAAGDRTVILSTHVLAEIEAVCERVVIINRGRIVASDRIDALATAASAVRVKVARPDAAMVRALEQLPGVQAVRALGEGSWELSTNADLREQIARVTVNHGLLELTGSQRLEDIYLRLTAGAEA